MGVAFSVLAVMRNTLAIDELNDCGSSTACLVYTIVTAGWHYTTEAEMERLDDCLIQLNYWFVWSVIDSSMIMMLWGRPKYQINCQLYHDLL